MLVLNTDIFSMIKNDFLSINNYHDTPSFVVWPIDKLSCVTLYIQFLRFNHGCNGSLWWNNCYQYCLKRGVTPLPLDKLTFHDSYFRPHDNCKMMIPPPIKKLLSFQPNGFIVSQTSWIIYHIFFRWVDNFDPPSSWDKLLLGISN